MTAELKWPWNQNWKPANITPPQKNFFFFASHDRRNKTASRENLYRLRQQTTKQTRNGQQATSARDRFSQQKRNYPSQISDHVSRAPTALAPRLETGQHSTKTEKPAKTDTQLPPFFFMAQTSDHVSRAQNCQGSKT
ncbi:hypothetical protein Nepgr_021026 [Nepenthes gracilis]|uniref:Uncharacterized protein n=1 Tax=Nepenthes gracilis TaxID=150966 RepID=A0AAD3XWV0_NEPGR|nr:hypothetical protein Nepgr_021026 [Nepenthes gracilis]